jgi:sigma-B regulation protein RsbU (phosphoserine phosphatase)
MAKSKTKSIREMSERERKNSSLSSKVLRTTILGSLILGFVALAVGLGLYIAAIIDENISVAHNIALTGAMAVQKHYDAEPLVDAVMERYYSLSEEDRLKNGTEEYNKYFADLMERDDYIRIWNGLNTLRTTTDVEFLYLGVIDEKNKALVYIVDGTSDGPYCPGRWDPLDEERIKDIKENGYNLGIENTKEYGWLAYCGASIYKMEENEGSDPEALGYIFADVTLYNIRGKIISFLCQYFIAMFFIFVLFTFFLLRYLNGNMIRPINEITGAAERYARDKLEDRERTGHFSSLSIHTGDEIENLSLVMSDMERDLGIYEENLKKETADKERIKTELSLAARIQEDMLPSTFPAFPDRNEFEVYASMVPAREVGGDFYDFLMIDDDHLGLMIADVSGKGIPASLFMMMSMIVLRANLRDGLSPGKALEDLNEKACYNNKEEMFVTVWIAVLDIRTGHMIAANAGHEFPMLMHPGGEFEILKDKHGFVVGGLEGLKFEEYELNLERGAKIFVYTDGVPESTNINNELFGTERTVEVINQVREGTPEEILQAVTDATNEFVGEAEQFDDLTMLCLHYKGNADE